MHISLKTKTREEDCGNTSDSQKLNYI